MILWALGLTSAIVNAALACQTGEPGLLVISAAHLSWAEWVRVKLL